MNEGNPIPTSNHAAIAIHAALTTGVHGITAAGAALIDDADATAQRTTLGLGTAAEKNIPATGNASVTQVVYGTDTRLTDSRTPSAHAASHAPAGSDELPWTTAHGRGTTSAKPAAAAANAGYLYYDTDLSRLERSNGATWDVLTTGGGGGTWGSITGTLSSQTDLQNALNAKADLSGGNTLTGTQTVQAAATQDAIKIAGRAGGTSSYSVTITPLALSANRTLSAPDADGTIALLGANTFTGVQLVPDGTPAAPSRAFSSDTDTGFYRIGTNSIAAACGGITSFYVSASNFYKIGYGGPQRFTVRMANGTEAAPTKTMSGDDIGGLSADTFYDDGSGGTGFVVGAGIRFYATEDRDASTKRGQRTVFSVIPTGASASATRAILTEDGALLLGLLTATTSAVSSSLASIPRLQVIGTTSGADSCAMLSRFDATPGDSPQFILAKSRGTASTDFTAVASGDTLGIWGGEGADGTGFIRAGSIRCVVDGTVSAGVVPGSWVIYTNNTSGTATQALKIDSSQNVAVAGNVSIGAGKQYQINGVQLAMEDLKTPSDVTTNNATTSAHGLLPKLSGNITDVQRGDGTWGLPQGGLVASQVILKQTLGAATTAWTVTLPVSCKAIRARLICVNPTGTENSPTLGVNGTSTGHMQQSYSLDGTTIGANEATAPTMSNVPANSYVDFTIEIAIVSGVETSVKIISGAKTSNTNLQTSLMTTRIAQTADISSITVTGNQTNGIGAGSYVIVERVDADVSPVFGVVFSGTADKTVANTATETSLTPTTGTGSATLAANSFTVGKKLKLVYAGKYSSKASGPGNITIKAKLGTTVVNTTGAHALDAGETDQYWKMELVLTCRTTGATGTVIGQTSWDHAATVASAGVMQSAPMVATSAVTIDTTASLAAGVTAEFQTADAGNTITCTDCQIEWLN